MMMTMMTAKAKGTDIGFNWSGKDENRFFFAGRVFVFIEVDGEGGEREWGTRRRRRREEQK